MKELMEQISAAWQRPGVGEDLRTVGMQEPFALFSLFVGGPDEMSRYGADALVQTDDRTALEFSGPFAVFGGVQADHSATLRALLDEGRRPPAVARALAGATAAQWRDRGGMLMQAGAVDVAYHDYATALDLVPTDTATLFLRRPFFAALVGASMAAVATVVSPVAGTGR